MLLGERERARKMADAELVEWRLRHPPALGSPCGPPDSPRAEPADRAPRGIRDLLRRSPALLGSQSALADRTLGRGYAEPDDGRRLARRPRRSPRPGSRLRRPGAHLPRPAREWKAPTGGPTAAGVWRTGLEALTPANCGSATCSGGTLQPRCADGLDVTLKTVEAHLTRAYAKLGIERRGKASGILDRGKSRGTHPLASDPAPTRSWHGTPRDRREELP